MLLALLAMVKDEAHSIRATLESVRGVVNAWCVLDTGSTDDTVKIVDAFLVENEGGPGLFVGSFTDYADTRNRLLAMHEGAPHPAKYNLMLNADEILHGGEKLRAFLESYEGDEEAFFIEVRTPTNIFPYPRVLKTGSAWKYEGEIQEEPRWQPDHERVPKITIEGCWIEYRPSDPERHAARVRDRDLPLLERMLSRAETPAQRARAAILLAQTREQLGMRGGNTSRCVQELFSAFGWYALIASDQTVAPETMLEARWGLLKVVHALATKGVGVYAPHEMVERLRQVEAADPPATTYLVAAYRMSYDVKTALQDAYRAARVAREAVKDSEHPHDPHGLLWRSHHLAAVCAKELKHGPAMKKSAEAGIAAGGPVEVFAEYLGKGPVQ